MDGGAARPYLATAADERDARVSPDGKWVIYESNQTGRSEVYVQSYPMPGKKALISEGGGSDAAWRGDGRELYYWRQDQLMAVHLDARDTGGPPTARERGPLFRIARVDAADFDVSRDGTRFVMVSGGPRANRLIVALDALSATGQR
jgi:hypothetical protein